MKTTTAGYYAFRFAFGQGSQAVSQSTASSVYATRPDRVVTRFATCLAVFGFALSSFSLKQMLTNTNNKSTTNAIVMRKF